MRVFDATTGAQIQSFPAFPESSFTGGMFVSTGDFNGDGCDDYVLTPDQGGGPRVRIVDGKDPTQHAGRLLRHRGRELPRRRPDGGRRHQRRRRAGPGGGGRVQRRPAGRRSSTAARFVSGAHPAEAGGRLLRLRADAPQRRVRHGRATSTATGWPRLIAGGGPGGGPRVFALPTGRSCCAGGQQPRAACRSPTSSPATRTTVAACG